MASEPVLIIGAGVAGLVLAQSLKYRNIPFKIFERDPSIGYRRQGYRFLLSPDSAAALQQAISPELWILFLRCCESVKVDDGAVPMTFDAETGDLQSSGPVRPPGADKQSPEQSKTFHVDRTFLRQLLCLGIEEELHFGKSYESHQTADASVHVHFADGSTEMGRLLVAGDGIKSRVRSTLVLHLKLLDLEMHALYGKTILNSDFLEKFPESALGWGRIVDKSKPSDGMIYTAMIWNKKVSELSDGRLPDQPNYIYWILWTSSSPLTSASSNEDQIAYSKQVTRHWSQTFRLLIEHQDPASIVAIKLTSASPEISTWQTNPQVTLLGDAIHPMSPSGGMGAGSAIRDARTLADQISKHGISRSSLAEYEDAMRANAKAAILHSFQMGKVFFKGKEWDEYDETSI